MAWIIYNKYEKGYWNNNMGWVDKDLADRYRTNKHMQLPLNAVWEKD